MLNDGYMLFAARSRGADAPAHEHDNEIDEDEMGIPHVLPILPLKDTVIYPFTPAPLAVGQERSLRLIEDVVASDRLVVMVAQKDASIDGAGPEDAFRIGTVTRIERMMKMPDGTMRLLVQGIQRVRIQEYVSQKPYLKAKVEVYPDVEENGLEVDALVRNLQGLIQRIVELMPHIPDEVTAAVMNIPSPLHLVYYIAGNLRLTLEDRQELLETSSLREKLLKMTTFLNKELEVLELGKKIQGQVQDEMSKTQRDYMLREQIKALQRELGEDDEATAEISRLREEIDAAAMPPEADKEAKRELDRLSRMPQQAPEYSVIRTYLEYMIAMPWNKSTEQGVDVNRASRILEEDHYGLEKIKERILEYLAVRKIRADRADLIKATQESEMDDGTHENEKDVTSSPHKPMLREPILCFVGPPGVGKTSLGQSIARALGRKFVRMSLGGVRDEAEIRGHRRTYIGAMPGRIVQAIRRAESNDPVFILDEVDKLGMDYRGDPSSALLEVLDPEQNNTFRDHYLDVPFDLSKVMFIATANSLDSIPGPLRDRMEILYLSGYTEDEKLHIATKYLAPKQQLNHALTEEDMSFTDEAILTLVRGYTREAGVRNLEREIANICRKVVKDVALALSKEEPSKEANKKNRKKPELPITVTTEQVHEYLGKPRFDSELAERMQVPGIATGLAWTEVGGDILFIEATRMKGNKQLIITGQLGDVMKESAQAALSYVRSHAAEIGIDEDVFAGSDLHLHIPAGAIPKDGPSAGITMTTAIASLLTGRKVKNNLAMTGEITLRGKVLPIGGLKEKSLAAKRVGLNTIIVPRRNERDVEEFSEELKKGMTFIFVDTMAEVIENALEPLTPATPARKSRSNKAGKGEAEQQQPLVPVA